MIQISTTLLLLHGTPLLEMTEKMSLQVPVRAKAQLVRRRKMT